MEKANRLPNMVAPNTLYQTFVRKSREDMAIDILEIMKERHSVRQYKNQAIEPAKREEINSLINDVNAESKLSIQAFYDEPKCFDSFMAHYGKFENVKNYIAIVGSKKDQEKAGYYGEKIVLKNGKVTAKDLGGFYSKIDLGIAKYHFEVVTGHEIK